MVNPYGQSTTVANPNDPNYGGIASTPGYVPIYQPAPGDQEGLNAFKQMAMSKGPSPWALLSTQNQALQAQNERDKGAKSTAGAAAAARDQLAAQGGLSSGARERIAETGDTNYTNMSQDVGRQENLNNLQIGMNDQQNKIQELSQVPAMEQTIAANKMAEGKSENDFNQNLYNQQMQAWAAGQQANATAHAGKK